VAGATPQPAHSVIWLVCHYPETAEIDERIETACRLHDRIGAPIWIFGTHLARYESSVEQLIKDKVMARGVDPGAIVCSADLGDVGDCLDTVQEAHAIVRAARANHVTQLFAVSNALQLTQIRFLLQRDGLMVTYVPSRWVDRRPWYVLARLVVIPLAWAGVPRDFVLFRLLRRARATLAWWPF
jgi:hypothetical protein